MNLKLLYSKDNKVSFILEGITPAIANTIRRLVIDEVPVMAIDTVNIVKNSSAMYDEMLAHRLGMVPLNTDLKTYNLRSECKCEGKGCSNCQTTLILKAKGPSTVYSSDLSPKDKDIKPVYGKMPVVKLINKDQEIELEAVAVLGKGKEHAKFSPGLIFYRGVPEFSAKNNAKVPLCNVHSKSLNVKNSVQETKEKKCLVCNDYDVPDVEIKSSEKDFIFTLESWGQLSPKEILTRAMEEFDSKLSDFEKQIKKLKF